MSCLSSPPPLLLSPARPVGLFLSFPPPALSECHHCGLARLSVAMHRRAVLMVPKV
jgi:hypothetical protein